MIQEYDILNISPLQKMQIRSATPIITSPASWPAFPIFVLYYSSCLNLKSLEVLFVKFRMSDF